MMMSVTEESVKSAFYMQIPGVGRPRENFLIFFVINCHFGGHFAKILILFLNFCYEPSVFNWIPTS